MRKLSWAVLLPVWAGIAVWLIYRWVTAQTVPEAEPQVKKPAGRRKDWQIFTAALLFRAAMFLLMLLLARLVPGGGEPRSLPELLSFWDARHYIGLTEKGYTGYLENGRPIFLVFFPLYVWVCRVFTLVIPNVAAAGVLVSSLSYAAGCVYVYRLTEGLYGKAAAGRAVVFLSVFPFSFFFGTVMTEGLFLLTTAASLYYTSQHKWLAAGIWGALAAMTRMTGILTAAAMLVEYTESTGLLRRHDPKGWWRAWLPRFLACLLPGTGTLVYLGLNYAVAGNPFAFIGFQQHWFQGNAWLPDTVALLLQNVWGYRNQPLNTAVWIPELILFFLFLAVLLAALTQKQQKNFLLVYGFFYLTLTYSLSWLLSAGRYLSCDIAFFASAAALTGGRRWLGNLMIIASAVLMGIYFTAYLQGGQIM